MTPDPAPTRAYVFDLDGVLLDNSHRLPLIQRDIPDWDEYYAPARMLDDTPNWPAIHLAMELSRSGTIIVVTGRPERTRDTTASHLLVCGVPLQHLLMRADGDRRENHLLKLSTAMTLRRPWWDVRLWIDDNPRVAIALEGLEIPVLTLPGVGQFVTKGT